MNNVLPQFIRVIIKKYGTTVVYLLLFSSAIFGVSLVVSLVRELGTVNYNFRGDHHDFIAFYTGAKQAWQHTIGNIYLSRPMTLMQREIIPHPIGATGYMPFLNPPFLAVLLSPLAIFTINTARMIWLLINLVLATASLNLLTDKLGYRQRIVAILLLGITFPMYQSFIEGQVTILVLFACSLTYYFLRKGHKLYAGMGLVGLLIFPQFALMVFLALAYLREKTVLKGWLIGSGVLGAITLPFTGVLIYFGYVATLLKVTQTHFIDQATKAELSWRGNIDGSSGLNGFFNALLGPNQSRLANIIYAVSALVLVAASYGLLTKLGRKYNSKQDLRLFIVSLLVGLLIDPHLYSQGIIMVFLLLPALLGLFKDRRWLVVAILAVLANLAYIDQKFIVHPFAIAALLLAVVFAKQALENKKTSLY